MLELYTPDQWEIDKDSVTLDKLIGQGHFGQVYQGVLKLSDGTLKACAIKVCYLALMSPVALCSDVIIALTNKTSCFQIRTTHPTDLLQEASIMK